MKGLFQNLQGKLRRGRGDPGSQFWVKDSECKACYECDREFNLFVRKHHCRMCGGIHCDACSSNYLPPSAFPHLKNAKTSQRCCNSCYKHYLNSRAASGRYARSASVHAGGSQSARLEGAGGSTQWQRGGSNHTSPTPKLHRSVSHGRLPWNAVHSDPFLNSSSLHRQTVGSVTSARSARVWQQPLPSEPGNSGRLRHPAVTEPVTPAPSRSAPLQPLPTVAPTEVPKAEAAHAALPVAPVPAADVPGPQLQIRHKAQSRSFHAQPSLSRQRAATDTALIWEEPPALPGDYGARCAARPSATTVPSPTPRGSASHPPDRRLVRWFESQHAFGAPALGLAAAGRPSELLRLATVGRSADGDGGLPPLRLGVRHGLSKVACEHLRRIIAQLIAVEQIGDAGTWVAILHRLALEAALLLSPTAIARYAAASAAGDAPLDPRRYLKVKKVADAAPPAASRVVQGLVFTKNLTHRGMRREIAEPRVLLLQGALEYHRQNRLLALDTLIPQEPEYMRNSIQKATRFHPDVILVEKSASRLAQDMLRMERVSLGINVKASTLARLAKCSRIVPASHVDSITERHVIRCARFHVEDVTTRREGTPRPSSAGRRSSSGGGSGNGNGSKTGGGSGVVAPVAQVRRKTLMFLEGTREGLCATILLRGAAESELVRLKRVVRFAVYAAYCARLEVAFLADVASALAVTLNGSVPRPLSADGRLPPDPDGADSAPPPLAPGDTTVRTWAEWASAVGQACQAGVHPISSVSPYVKKWRMPMATGAVGGGTGGAAADPSDAASKEHCARQGCAALYYEQSTQVSHAFRNCNRQRLCQAPTVRRYTHYGSGDQPLLRFLEGCLPSKCPECGDGTIAHIRTFLHGGQRLSLSVYSLGHSADGTANGVAPEAAAAGAGGAAKGATAGGGAVWLWARVKGRPEVAREHARRLRLSATAHCVSFGHLLELMCSRVALNVAGACLNKNVVLFFRVGHWIVCLNPDQYRPFEMVLPSDPLSADAAAYGRAIQHEAVSLTMEVSKSFETLLQQIDGILCATITPDARAPRGPPPASPMRGVSRGKGGSGSFVPPGSVAAPDSARQGHGGGGGLVDGGDTDRGGSVAGAAGPGTGSAGIDQAHAALAASIADWEAALCAERDELLEAARAVSSTVSSDEEVEPHAALRDERLVGARLLPPHAQRLVTLHLRLIALRCRYRGVLARWAERLLVAAHRVRDRTRAAPLEATADPLRSRNDSGATIANQDGDVDGGAVPAATTAPAVPPPPSPFDTELGPDMGSSPRPRRISGSSSVSLAGAVSGEHSARRAVVVSLRTQHLGGVRVTIAPASQDSAARGVRGARAAANGSPARRLRAPIAHAMASVFDSGRASSQSDGLDSTGSTAGLDVSLRVGMGPDLRAMAMTALPEEVENLADSDPSASLAEPTLQAAIGATPFATHPGQPEPAHVSAAVENTALQLALESAHACRVTADGGARACALRSGPAQFARMPSPPRGVSIASDHTTIVHCSPAGSGEAGDDAAGVDGTVATVAEPARVGPPTRSAPPSALAVAADALLPSQPAEMFDVHLRTTRGPSTRQSGRCNGLTPTGSVIAETASMADLRQLVANGSAATSACTGAGPNASVSSESPREDVFVTAVEAPAWSDCDNDGSEPASQPRDSTTTLPRGSTHSAASTHSAGPAIQHGQGPTQLPLDDDIAAPLPPLPGGTAAASPVSTSNALQIGSPPMLAPHASAGAGLWSAGEPHPLNSAGAPAAMLVRGPDPGGHPAPVSHAGAPPGTPSHTRTSSAGTLDSGGAVPVARRGLGTLPTLRRTTSDTLEQLAIATEGMRGDARRPDGGASGGKLGSHVPTRSSASSDLAQRMRVIDDASGTLPGASVSGGGTGPGDAPPVDQELREMVGPHLKKFGVHEDQMDWFVDKLHNDQTFARTYTEDKILEGLSGWETKLAGEGAKEGDGGGAAETPSAAARDALAPLLGSRAQLPPLPPPGARAGVHGDGASSAAGAGGARSAGSGAWDGAAAAVALPSPHAPEGGGDAGMPVPMEAMMAAGGLSNASSLARLSDASALAAAAVAIGARDRGSATGPAAAADSRGGSARAGHGGSTPFGSPPSGEGESGDGTGDGSAHAGGTYQGTGEGSISARAVAMHSRMASSSSAHGGDTSARNLVATARRVSCGFHVMPTEGVAGIAIPIFPSEPTSAIAYFLCSATYQQQLAKLHADALRADAASAAPSHPMSAGNLAGHDPSQSGAHFSPRSDAVASPTPRSVATDAGTPRALSAALAFAAGLTGGSGRGPPSVDGRLPGGALGHRRQRSGRVGSGDGGGGVGAVIPEGSKSGSLASASVPPSEFEGPRSLRSNVGGGAESAPPSAPVSEHLPPLTGPPPASKLAPQLQPTLDEGLRLLSMPTKASAALEFTDAPASGGAGTGGVAAGGGGSDRGAGGEDGGGAGLSSAAGGPVRCKVEAYYALQFSELRRRVIDGGDLAFLLSLSRCKRWRPRGGKSPAYFAKTHDERYVIKQLSKSERASFQEFAPHYFRHCAEVIAAGAGSCLSRVLGFFTVYIRNEFQLDLVVTENVFYEKTLARTFDLKGTLRAAKDGRDERAPGVGAQPVPPNAVGLDSHFRQHTVMRPITVSPCERQKLMAALRLDTAFLARVGVMDYSLLLGVDRPNVRLVVGIIDYIRQYTWDKQVETWVKSSGLISGGNQPTVISPKQYMKRFRNAMEGYFTVVPYADKLPEAA